MIINNSVSTKPPTLPTSPTTTSTTSKPTQTWWPTPSPTQPPTRPPTRPPTQPPTRPPTQPPTRPPTQPPTRPPTQLPTQPPSETNCVNGQYYPVPDDCSSFARCVDGVLKKNKCSPGLHWNVAETLCDWPTNANCEADGHGNAPILIYPVTFLVYSLKCLVSYVGHCIDTDKIHNAVRPDCWHYATSAKFAPTTVINPANNNSHHQAARFVGGYRSLSRRRIQSEWTGLLRLPVVRQRPVYRTRLSSWTALEPTDQSLRLAGQRKLPVYWR